MCQAPTLNFYLQLCICFNPNVSEIIKRFYIFTGKGGVGKTTLSLSFSKYLSSENKKVQYTYFTNSKLEESPHIEKYKIAQYRELGIHINGLDLASCAQGYIAKKLNSKTIASWIIRTPFFTSLINMIPGFNYVIFLGQILQDLEDDPNLIIVLDAPASGHTLTMLEATRNFSNIFQNGAIFDDTNTMLNRMNEKDFLKINIITIPTLLSIQEAIELKDEISKSNTYEIEIYGNYSLKTHSNSDLPEFLTKKIENEQFALDSSTKLIPYNVDFMLSTSESSLIKDLAPSMKNLV